MHTRELLAIQGAEMSSTPLTMVPTSPTPVEPTRREQVVTPTRVPRLVATPAVAVRLFVRYICTLHSTIIDLVIRFSEP